MSYDAKDSDPDDFDADYDDFDDWGDNVEGHGFDCDCDECTNEWHESMCGELSPDLGGGCSNAGSEYCEFECPFRNRVINGQICNDEVEHEDDVEEENE